MDDGDVDQQDGVGDGDQQDGVGDAEGCPEVEKNFCSVADSRVKSGPPRKGLFEVDIYVVVWSGMGETKRFFLMRRKVRRETTNRVGERGDGRRDMRETVTVVMMILIMKSEKAGICRIITVL